MGVTLAELIATGQDAGADRAVQARALLHRQPRLRARRCRGQSLNPKGPDRCSPASRSRRPPSMRPIADVAAEAGIEPDELELFGRYKAKVDLSILDRLAGVPDAKLINVTAITPTPAGEGKTTTSVVAHAGLRQDRPAGDARAAGAVARPRVRRQGRRRGRRLRAGGADGGHQPPLHRRHACDHGGEQPALGAGRRAPLPPARAGDRDRHVAACDRRHRPPAAEHRRRPRRREERRSRPSRASTSRPRAR